jgi:hypothetical protein
VLSLARSERPRVCFVPTASGDSPAHIANFYRAFAGHHDCEPSDLGLFERGEEPLAARLLSRTAAGQGSGSSAAEPTNVVSIPHTAIEVTFVVAAGFEAAPSMPGVQSVAIVSSRRSVTNMWPGAWVIISSGFEATATAWGVTPQAQNTGSSPSRISTGSP